LGEIIDLEIIIGGQKHNINALVMEKGRYDLLLGNIWACEHNVKLDWKAGWFTCEIHGKEVELPVTCTNPRQKSELNQKEEPEIINPPEEIEDNEFEYEEEELIEQPLLWAQEDNGEVSMKFRMDQKNIQINNQLVDQITLDQIRMKRLEDFNKCSHLTKQSCKLCQNEKYIFQELEIIPGLEESIQHQIPAIN